MKKIQSFREINCSEVPNSTNLLHEMFSCNYDSINRLTMFATIYYDKKFTHFLSPHICMMKLIECLGLSGIMKLNGFFYLYDNSSETFNWHNNWEVVCQLSMYLCLGFGCLSL